MALTLKAMEYFTTALRHGNIARAAGELNIAASAVASAIDQIEADFGLTLVTRQRSRGITATASGLAVARRCEHLLEEYRALLAEGSALQASPTGSLRIGYYAPVAPAFLPEILASFVPDPAEVTLHLEECDNISAQDGVLNGRFDVALCITEGARPALEYDVLLDAPPYCLLPVSHPLARQGSITLAEIARERLIVLNVPVAAAYYRSLLGADAQEVPVAAYANSTEMVRSLVASGYGCAILNMRPGIATTYGGGDVVERPISDPLPPLSLAVAYDKSRPRRLVQLFVEACRDHFAARGADWCAHS